MTQGSTFYVYDPWGRRIWKQWTGQTGANECEAYFYGATGQKLEATVASKPTQSIGLRR